LLVEDACPGAAIDVGANGNVLAASASLYGIAAEELRAPELDHNDPAFPVITWARISRPE
jgi:hypothetical protein